MALNAATLKNLIDVGLTAQGFNLGDPYCFASKLSTAISNAVVSHITADSELTATTSDSGSAGSGIITGKVM